MQGGGNFDIFDELFADDFLDHTPQPGRTADKAGARELYRALRAAFPDFHADIHWQIADGDCVTTYKTYHGTHRGEFLGVAPTGRKIQFETVDVMRVRNGKIAEHWGVANLFSLLQQLGAWPASRDRLSSVSASSASILDCSRSDARSLSFAVGHSRTKISSARCSIAQTPASRQGRCSPATRGNVALLRRLIGDLL